MGKQPSFLTPQVKHHPLSPQDLNSSCLLRDMAHWASRSPTPLLHSNPCLIPGSALGNKTTIGLVIGPQTGFHGLPEAGGRLSGGESSPTRAVSATYGFRLYIYICFASS